MNSLVNSTCSACPGPVNHQFEAEESLAPCAAVLGTALEETQTGQESMMRTHELSKTG